MSDKCVVIIVAFDKDRDGLKEDLAAISETFSMLFDAEFIILINESKDKIREQYRKFLSDEWLDKFRNAKFVTIFCLAHGYPDGVVVLKEDQEVADARRLLLCPLFKSKELDGKLKWLVVQACRGEMNDYRPMDRDGKKTYFSDIHFISYCTGEGTVSFQKDKNGKTYIQELCGELKRNVRNLSLCAMLRNVATAVERFGRTQECVTFQRPNFCANTDDYSFYE